jgi:predicted RNase H-like HicB family nuclease
MAKYRIQRGVFSEYIQAALKQAEYDTLEDGSYMATVPGLQGVIAIGDTLGECCTDLIEVIEEWIVARLEYGYPVPPIGSHSISSSKEPIVIVD